jgi:ribosomal protein L32
MAVPKKRTSRSKKNSRQATWVTKIYKQAKQSKQAFSLASSVVVEKIKFVVIILSILVCLCLCGLLDTMIWYSNKLFYFYE